MIVGMDYYVNSLLQTQNRAINTVLVLKPTIKILKANFH